MQHNEPPGPVQVALVGSKIHRVGLIDLAVCAVAAAICVAYFRDGGVVGLAGAMLGAGSGFCQSTRAALVRRVEALMRASLGGLWAGMMLGGMTAGLLGAALPTL